MQGGIQKACKGVYKLYMCQLAEKMQGGTDSTGTDEVVNLWKGLQLSHVGPHTCFTGCSSMSHMFITCLCTTSYIFYMRMSANCMLVD